MTLSFFGFYFLQNLAALLATHPLCWYSRKKEEKVCEQPPRRGHTAHVLPLSPLLAGPLPVILHPMSTSPWSRCERPVQGEPRPGARGPTSESHCPLAIRVAFDLTFILFYFIFFDLTLKASGFFFLSLINKLEMISNLQSWCKD